MEELLDILRSYQGLEDIVMVDFNTHMYNLNTGLGCKILIGQLSNGQSFLDFLNDTLEPLDRRRRAEKRENYAPLTIMLPSEREDKKVTCQLFTSGTLQISGPMPQDIANAYETVVTFLEKHKALVTAPYQPSDLEEELKKNFRSWLELIKTHGKVVVAHTHFPVRFIVPGCRYCELYGNVFAPPSPPSSQTR